MKILLILFQLGQQVLLMHPIEKAVQSGDFSGFKKICKAKISTNLENPFQLKGFFYIGKFIEEFSARFLQYKVKKREWISLQIDGDFAIQSLNLVLKSKRTERPIFYKFMFFMSRDEVNIVRFDGEKSLIIFQRDPEWAIGAEFEVSGSEYSTNNGHYEIIEKRGISYRIIRRVASSAMVSDNRPGFKAKAWKLYYLRGLRI